MGNDVCGYTIARGRVGHVEFEKKRIAKGARPFAFALPADLLHDLRRNRFPEKWRDGVSDLPESMPLGDVEPEPIRV